MKLFTLLTIISAFLYQAALADGDSGNYTCTLGLNTVAFGSSFNPLNNTPEQMPVNLSINCTLISGFSSSVNYTVSFSAGHGNMTARIMDGTKSDTLNYNLYADSAYSTQILGDGTGGTYTFNDNYFLGFGGCNSPCTVNHTIYAKIPVQPLAMPDPSYTDALTVTLTYNSHSH
jgi:spore coat protein U-like protein